MSSIVTNSARHSRPKSRKSICSGLRNDASAPSNVRGIRFAAMMPMMLECIFSARAVLLARAGAAQHEDVVVEPSCPRVHALGALGRKEKLARIGGAGSRLILNHGFLAFCAMRSRR